MKRHTIKAGTIVASASRRRSCCKRYLRDYQGRLGMGECPCGRQWYHFAPGWAKKWGTEKVYHLGSYAGLDEAYGALRRIVEGAAS
jgi:hypothetical protein